MNWLQRLVFSLIISGAGNSAFSEELVVATWNLENFSGQDYAGCRERSQSDYDELRRIINAVDADIWLFQEVESAGALARILDPTKWTLHAEKRDEWSRPYKCQESGRSATMQRTAIASKNGLSIGEQEDLRFLDTSGSGYLRHGLALNIAHGGKRIHVVNVHLKSGCSSGSEGEACNTLFEQAPYLSAFISEKSESGLPIIVGGDFNRQLGVARR